MFELLLSFVTSQRISKIATSLLNGCATAVGKNIAPSLKKTDIEKAIKAGEKAVKEWNKKLDRQQRLFVDTPLNPFNKFKNYNFLRNYFTNSGVVAELQKPLINKGNPNRDILIKAFQKQAEANNIKLNQKASLQDWIETFVKAYVQNTPTYIKFQVAKENYCGQLVKRLNDVTFAGMAVAGQDVEKSEKLAQIFVMPDVVEEVATARDLESKRLPVESGEKPERAVFKNITPRKFLADQLLIQNQSRRVVILGAPGSGKSTLMSYFAVMLAQSKAEVLGLDPDTDWLPILIRIRDVVSNPDQKLIDYARMFAENKMSVKSLPVGFFDHYLSDGRALILLDGLDEVADDYKRNEIVTSIKSFLSNFNRNPAIITSRPAGYRPDFFRTDDFPHYQIEPFDDQNISDFLNNWYRSRVTDKAEAERRKKSLIKALDDNDRIKLLARNPLLLTIIALIHWDKEKLPKKRFELYQKAVDTFLKWDAKRKGRSDNPLRYLDFEDNVSPLMEYLAYWIHTQGNLEDNDSGTLIHHNNLIDQLKQQIKNLKPNKVKPHQAREEAKRFVEFIRDRTGLLNEQGQDCYAFVHKTFQEYLCAKDIHERADDDFDIVLNHIREHLHDSHWREVLLLLIAQQKRKKAAKAIKIVLNNKSDYEQWLHRDLLFAGNCLAEDPSYLQIADSELVQEILERLVKLEVSGDERVGYNINHEVYQIICSFYETDFQAPVLELLKNQSDLIDQERLLNYRAELGEKDQVIEIWLERLKDNDSDVRITAASALGKLGNSSETVVNGLLALLEDNDSDVRMSAAYALGELGNSSDTVVNGLLALLEDNDSSVRSSAAHALGKLGNSSDTVVKENIVNGLLALLEHHNSDVRMSAAYALGELGNSSDTVVNGLLPLVEDNESSVRMRAADALGKLGNSSDTVVNGLLPLVEDNESSVRSSAAYALGKLGKDSETVVKENIVKSLLPLVEDNDSNVRSSAASALGELGNSSDTVVNALLALLEDNESDVRSSAASALGELGNSSDTVVNGLLALLQDNESYVRMRAADALVQLGNSSDTLVNGLIALLQDNESYVRMMAADALGKLGNSSDTVVNALIALLEDNDFFMRSSASRALVQLGKRSIIPTLTEWIEQHQDSDYVGNGIDVLWNLVVYRE
ncbi:MAG: NACHT domain-containing protein [Moorea sp. SIO1G6]|uniref:HEAT repeat domain-containing protein n=1 Tax=Moorena sp. SIO1G6 TaxID=2607840 RepID=UPI0013C14D9B|nr:HEAT repeat domain-containing protein [Moorena sp. SIO1G6]NET68352.1 NACHT domain-containing protein [Moorena sp. SIO1G6]